jgi:hypothetical protein
MPAKPFARWKPSVALLASFALTIAPLGCRSTSLKEVTFSDQPSAGSVHVAAQSIAPFDEYIDSLQPRFDLSSAQALDQAIPLVALREVQELRSLVANLKAAFPRLKANEEGKYSAAPGETTDLTAPPGATLPDQTPLALPGFDKLQMDPTLRFHAAASLFQEVSLLSSYVRDAAVSKGQVPYVVRLLITSLPNARTSPYDFYATVGFFEEPNTDAPFAIHGSMSWQRWLERIVEARRETEEEISYYESRSPVDRNAQKMLKEQLANVERDERIARQFYYSLVWKPCGRGAVSVIPLFATESYETSLLSSVFASSQSIGLSTGGSLGTVGLDAAAQMAAENRERTLVNSVNQPFSVARVAENTLQVRLGAVFSGTRSGFVTPARTYNLTALVLVRNVGEPPGAFLDITPCPAIRFRAHTEIRRIGHSSALERWTLMPEQLTRSIVASFPGDSPRARAARRAAKELTPALLEQDYDAFLKKADHLETDLREAIWLHSQEAMAAWGISMGRFRAPDRLFNFFSDSSDATLVDDGKSAVLKVTDPSIYVPAGGLSAQLHVNDATFPANRVSMSADGQTAIASFPSIKSACDPKVSTSPPCRLEAKLSWRKPVFRWGNLQNPKIEWSSRSGRRMAVRYVQPEKSQSLPKPQLTVPAGRIVLAGPDSAIVSVIVRPGRLEPDTPERKPVALPAALSVSGAEIIEVPSLSPSARFWTVSSDATLVLRLRNVLLGGTVRIQAATLKADGEIDEGAVVFQDLTVVPPSKND